MASRVEAAAVASISAWFALWPTSVSDSLGGSSWLLVILWAFVVLPFAAVGLVLAILRWRNDRGGRVLGWLWGIAGIALGWWFVRSGQADGHVYAEYGGYAVASGVGLILVSALVLGRRVQQLRSTSAAAPIERR